MLQNLKYDVYQYLGIIFPKYFKRKMMYPLISQLKKGNNKLPPEKELLILHLFVNSDSTIIDVGANNGLYCYYFEEIIHASNIYAFEPIPTLFKKLQRWFPNINLSDYAISDKNGSSLIRIPYINDIKFYSRAKLDDLRETNETFFKKHEIQTRCLDSIFLEKKCPIHFIKIDIEGHELNSIIGAREIIKLYKPTLMVEIEARHHQNKVDTVVEYVLNLGYECYFLDFENNKLKPFIEFNSQIHQNENSNGNNYINNFLFFPLKTINLIDINKSINSIILSKNKNYI